MKNYLLLSLMCIAPLYAANKEQAVFDAIHESKLHSCKKALSDLGQLSQEQKNAFLKASEEVVEEKNEQVGLFKSKPDLGLCAAGLSLAIANGLIYHYFAGPAIDDMLYRKNYSGKNMAITGSFIIGFAASVYLNKYHLFDKGWNCEIAKQQVAMAKQIQQLIEKTEVSS